MYSIIVPIYKVEQYLSHCIESILAQTHEDFELILVNDGSPDGCPTICDAYAKKDSRIKVIHKENGGLVSARKAGLEKAKGEYICFVDGDDFITAETLETFDKLLIAEKYDVICAEYSKYYSKERIVPVKQNIEGGCYDKNGLINTIYPQMLSSSTFYTFGVMPSLVTKCIKKNILCEVYKNMPDEISLGEDVAVSYPVLLKSSKVYFLHYSGYMYRQNPDSMTRSYDKNLYEKVRNLILHLKAVKNDNNWDDNGQIDAYAVYLLVLAKNNEFKFNTADTYRVQKANMKRYLKDPVFEQAIKHTTLHGMKYNFLLFCFRTHFLMPIYLYERIVRARGSNE